MWKRFQDIVGATKKRIMEAIGDRPGHGYELADRLGLPTSSIYNHLKDLSESGLVESDEHGRRKVYTLTENGEKLLGVLE